MLKKMIWCTPTGSRRLKWTRRPTKCAPKASCSNAKRRESCPWRGAIFYLMIEITAKIKPGTGAQISGQLRLSYDLRQKRWLRARLVSGEEVALKLRRGETLRAGDLLAAPDGSVIEVAAAPEKVLHVECASALELARI